MESTKHIPAAAPEVVLIPKDYMLGPVFASKPQKEARGRLVQVRNKIYQIGGFHPFRKDNPPPALDIRHGRVLVVLLGFRDPFNPEKLVSFSMNEFAFRYSASNGGRYARDLQKLLGDWTDTWLKITVVGENKSRSYRALERVEVTERAPRKRDSRLIKNKQEQFWLSGATMSPEFAELLSNIDELQHIKAKSLLALTSPLAQSIYWYIPSRASHHTEAEPFEITITNLLQQVEHPVPHKKSLRRQIFTQNGDTSILTQLDGKETLTGVFRVRLAETSDGTDWKLQAWVEREGQGGAPKAPPKTKSKLLQAFLDAGHTQEEINERLGAKVTLNDYETELLDRAKVELAGNTRFFELAKALLGETHFDSLLAEAKGEEVEGTKATKNNTARLIYRISEAVSKKSGK